MESALKHLAQAARSDPDNAAVRTQLRELRAIDDNKTGGDESFKSGRYSEAVDRYSQCLVLLQSLSIVGPSGQRAFASKVHLNRATARVKLGSTHLEDAVKDCNVAIGFNSSYLKAFLRRAECLLSLGGSDRIEAAITYVICLPCMVRSR